MRYVLIALFTLVLQTNASAQPTIKIEFDYAPTVTVSDDSFADMCSNFAKKAGRIPASGIMMFRPKVMPLGQDEKSGSIWIIGTMGKQVEIAQSELPPSLQKIRGLVARNILQAACYTENTTFFGRRDIVFTTLDSADASALAVALR